MDPFFPEFSCGVTCLLRIGRRGMIPKISCSSVKTTWISAAVYPGIHSPNVLTSSTRQPILQHHFSSTICWADCQPQRAKTDTYRRICIPLQFCNFETIGTRSTTEFHQGLTDCTRCGKLPPPRPLESWLWQIVSKKKKHQVSLCTLVSKSIETRRACISYVLLSRQGGGRPTERRRNLLYLGAVHKLVLCVNDSVGRCSSSCVTDRHAVPICSLIFGAL